jgi:hypothetical protein
VETLSDLVAGEGVLLYASRRAERVYRLVEVSVSTWQGNDGGEERNDEPVTLRLVLRPESGEGDVVIGGLEGRVRAALEDGFVRAG